MGACLGFVPDLPRAAHESTAVSRRDGDGIMAKKGKGWRKDTKKPTARKPAPKSKKPAAKAKKKAPARAAPRPPFTDSDLKDKDGVKIREFAAYYAENPEDEQAPFEVYALGPSTRSASTTHETLKRTC